jgi:hypothetical protein
MMEAASAPETSVNFYQTYGATTQKTAIFKYQTNLTHTKFHYNWFKHNLIDMISFVGIAVLMRMLCSTYLFPSQYS